MGFVTLRPSVHLIFVLVSDFVSDIVRTSSMMFSCESAIGPMGTMVSANDVCSEDLRLFWSARDPNVSCSRAAGNDRSNHMHTS